MDLPRVVIAFLNLSLLAAAGDVSGHAVITKRLTKKPVAPAVYSLRGAAPTVAPKAMPKTNSTAWWCGWKGDRLRQRRRQLWL